MSLPSLPSPCLSSLDSTPGELVNWTLEKAKNSFSEVVRRALAHEPQIVIRGGREDEAVVVISRADYEQLLAPVDLVAFFRDSPLAEAIASGVFGDPDSAEIFPRDRSLSRDVQFE
jgi:antitoxin Phd